MSLLRRRMMMQQQEKKEEWDYELYPDTDGKIALMQVPPPSTATGFYIEFDGFINFKGRPWDAREMLGGVAYIADVTAAQEFRPLSPNDRSGILMEYNAVGTSDKIRLGDCCADWIKFRWTY